MKTILPALLVGLWLLPFTGRLPAQDHQVFFKEYDVKEGMPEGFVTSIVQDDQGFIWFTTQNGLVKYDGYDFEIFGPYQGTQKRGGLKLHHLNGGVIKGKSGKLWIGGF